MTAPKKFDSMADILRKGVDIGESPEAKRADEEEMKTAAIDRPEKLRPLTPKNSTDALSQEAAPIPWWIIAGLIVLFVVALTAWLTRQKLKPTN
jgi:hypothetical protein